MNKLDVGKALELRMVKGMTYSDIGQYFGVSKQRVHQALKRFNNLMLLPAELEAYRAQKPAILESVEAQLLNDVVDVDRRQKASLNNVAYALGTVGNMVRLENNQSTSNVAYQEMTGSLEEIRQKRKQLEEAIDAY